MGTRAHAPSRLLYRHARARLPTPRPLPRPLLISFFAVTALVVEDDVMHAFATGDVITVIAVRTATDVVITTVVVTVVVAIAATVVVISPTARVVRTSAHSHNRAAVQLPCDDSELCRTGHRPRTAGALRASGARGEVPIPVLTWLGESWCSGRRRGRSRCRWTRCPASSASARAGADRFSCGFAWS
ncbi:hypothetical protein [Streptomyces graminofaciens]|uniref:hypothetical protein n=1 Tax=Streptomyces graminofaciens TaxID=68212 RepID=UPI002574236D|nr:hypothetical protein [Streptomyces graminofaciens]